VKVISNVGYNRTMNNNNNEPMIGVLWIPAGGDPKTRWVRTSEVETYVAGLRSSGVTYIKVYTESEMEAPSSTAYVF